MMDADSNNAATLSAGGDRLSRLDDAVLGHILSFLPAAEAARAAWLSRRWRHIFSAVHSLSFREAERSFAMGYPWFHRHDCCDSNDPDGMRPPRLVTGVGAALFLRDRRGPRFAAAAAPLRALRVAFDEFGFLGGDDATNAVDGWLTYAAYHAADDDLEIDLRFHTGKLVCTQAYALLPPGSLDADEDEELPEQEFAMDKDNTSGPDPDLDAGRDDQTMENYYYYTPQDYAVYTTPKSLLTCAALRTLRLAGCRLDTPSAISIPSLATLHLTRVTSGSGGRIGAVERLVAACPRLAYLTLEGCWDVTRLSVAGGARLRQLALRCCHGLASVAVPDSSELRIFEYRGPVPPGPRFLTVHGPRRRISLCTVDLCGQESVGTPELRNLVHFLRQFDSVKRLHLTSARLGCGVGRCGVFFPAFPVLRNLELTGMLPGDDTTAIAAVTRILERTPSLETLTLFFLPQPHPLGPYINSEEDIHATHNLRYNRLTTLAVPDVDIPCLRKRMREINLVHYQGGTAQRMLAKFLLRNAHVVDEVWCEFARGPFSIQTKLMGEIKGWVLNKSANVMFR